MYDSPSEDSIISETISGSIALVDTKDIESHPSGWDKLYLPSSIKNQSP